MGFVVSYATVGDQNSLARCGGGDFYAHLLPESFESQAFRRHVGELSARPHPTQGRSGTEYDALSGHPHQYNQHFGESPSSDVLKDRERAHWRGP